MPILLTTSPLRAMRSVPTMMRSILPAAIRLAAALSQMRVRSMPAAPSSQAVRRAPWNRGRVSST